MKLRLVRTLPAFAPRPPIERSDFNLDAIHAVAFVPGSNDVVVHGRFGIQRFALAREAPAWRVEASGRWGSSIAVSPDGTRLLTISDDEALVERDITTGTERRRERGVWSTQALAFSADGAELVWGGSLYQGNPGGFSVPLVELRDATTFAVRWRWTGEDWKSVSSACVTTRGVLVAQGTTRPVLRLDRATGAPLKTLRQFAGILRASLDGRTAILCNDHELRVHRDGRLAGKVATVRVDCCAIAPSGSFAAISTIDDRSVTVIELTSMRVVDEITGDDADLDRVTSVACTDLGHVAIGCVGGWTHIAKIV
jgi:WD40 repeat protein